MELNKGNTYIDSEYNLLQQERPVILCVHVIYLELDLKIVHI